MRALSTVIPSMRSLLSFFAWAFAQGVLVSAVDVNLTVVPAAVGFKGDNTGFVYACSPLLVVNDGSAADGGFREFAFSNSTRLEQRVHRKTGRSKVALPIHDIAERNLIINIPAPDSVIRTFDAETGKKVDSNEKTQLGDWSTACVWHSRKSGEQYFFLFGKKMVVQFLAREKKGKTELLEVYTLTRLPGAHERGETETA